MFRIATTLDQKGILVSAKLTMVSGFFRFGIVKNLF
jgi:hypothetical protein